MNDDVTTTTNTTTTTTRADISETLVMSQAGSMFDITMWCAKVYVCDGKKIRKMSQKSEKRKGVPTIREEKGKGRMIVTRVRK